MSDVTNLYHGKFKCNGFVYNAVEVALQESCTMNYYYFLPLLYIVMSSKLEYLKRYKKGSSGSKKKKLGAKATPKSNYFVIDDDVNWKSDAEQVMKCEDDPDDAPLVAELRDESVVKWQPLSGENTTNPTGGKCVDKREDASPMHSTDLSPPRRVQHIASDSKFDYGDLSPPRKKFHSRDKKPKHPEQDLKASGSELSPPRRTQRINERREIDAVDKTGRFAETVYRNRVNDHSVAKVDENVEKNDEEFMQWGRG